MRKDTGFYIQMHLHTAEASRCARVGGADMARAPARKRAMI